MRSSRTAGPILGSAGDAALKLMSIASSILHQNHEDKALNRTTLVCKILVHVEVDSWEVTDA